MWGKEIEAMQFITEENVIFFNVSTRYPAYLSPAERIKSFQGAQHNLLRDKEIYSEAGFFLQAPAERLVCHCCGLILEHYGRAYKEPMETHALFAASCSYVFALKDKTFVDKVRQKWIEETKEIVQTEEDSQESDGKCNGINKKWHC